MSQLRLIHPPFRTPSQDPLTLASEVIKATIQIKDRQKSKQNSMHNIRLDVHVCKNQGIAYTRNKNIATRMEKIAKNHFGNQNVKINIPLHSSNPVNDIYQSWEYFESTGKHM
jgi:hypothetical protein